MKSKLFLGYPIFFSEIDGYSRRSRWICLLWSLGTSLCGPGRNWMETVINKVHNHIIIHQMSIMYRLCKLMSWFICTQGSWTTG